MFGSTPPWSIARDIVNGVLVSTIDLAKDLPARDIAACFPPGEPRYETHMSNQEDDKRFEWMTDALAYHDEQVAKLRLAVES